jgi:hypothetical protein
MGKIMRTPKETPIDSLIPVEQQIAFLRQAAINFKFTTYQALKGKFGDEGVEIFKSIWRQIVRQGLDKLKDKNFEEIKKLAGLQDRIFGFCVEPDYMNADEFQYSITYCPYLEACKQTGSDAEFCNIIEDVEMEEVSKRLGEMTEPTRMCHGDSKCTIRIRNTLR